MPDLIVCVFDVDDDVRHSLEQLHYMRLNCLGRTTILLLAHYWGTVVNEPNHSELFLPQSYQYEAVPARAAIVAACRRSLPSGCAECGPEGLSGAESGRPERLSELRLSSLR